MFPILARYGSTFVYSYTVVLAAGVLAAAALTARLARDGGPQEWFDALLAILLGAILGGRAGFVAGQWAYYQDHLGEIWRIGQGGLAYHAALLGGLLALLLWTTLKGRDFYAYGALAMPGTAVVTAFGWAACWLEGCAYGRETLPGPLSAEIADEFGVLAVRYQTQLLGLLLALLVLAVLLWLRPRVSAAVLFWCGVGLLGAAHLLPGLWRGDPLPASTGLRIDVILDVLMVLSAPLGIQYVRARQS